MSSARGENPVEMYQWSLCINNGINSLIRSVGEEQSKYNYSVSLRKKFCNRNETGGEVDVLVSPHPHPKQTADPQRDLTR